MSVIEMETAATEYRDLQAQIKDLEEQAETLKQQMIREMDINQVDKMQAGPFEIRYTLVESSRLDTARLKAEHADIYTACCKRMTSTRFQVA